MLETSDAPAPTWLHRLVPPLVVFALTGLGAAVVARHAGFAPFDATTWTHWDALQYEQIARHGYDCSHGGCEAAAWFPGYPFLAGAAHQLGVPLSTAMLLVARLAALGTLLVVWNGLLDCRRALTSYAALVFAAVLPGAVYFQALFPMSMATLLLCTTVALVRRERWWPAAVALALAATTYPVILPIGASMALWAAVSGGGGGRARLGRSVPLAVGAVVGGAAVVGVMWWQSGQWDVFRRAQRAHPYRAALPFVTWLHRIDDLWRGHEGRTVALQALLVLVILVAVTVNELRRRDSRVAALVLCMGWTTWAFPLSLDQLSPWRVDSLLVPLAFAVARLPKWAAVAVTVAAALLLPPMVVVYVRDQLV